MACTHAKHGNMVVHICGPEAEGSAVVHGRTYRWDFHSYLGPSFLKKNGEPLKNQPGERHAVWGPFGEWLKKYEAGKRAAQNRMTCAQLPP